MAQAARPLLASNLLDAAKARRRALKDLPVIAPDRGISAQTRFHQSLRTGFEAVDDQALDGGFRYGHDGVVGIAAEETRVGLELAYSLLTSQLLDHPTSRAFYIDTSKTFDPQRLEKCIHSRLESERPGFVHEGGYVYCKTEHDTDGDAQFGEPRAPDERTKDAMDRISMMRVFDFDGLLEAVHEVKALLRGGDAEKQPLLEGRHDVRPQQDASDEVADSQPVSQGSVFEDEDMLMDIPAPRFVSDSQPSSLRPDPFPPPQGPFLIIIPSAARVLSPLMHSNHVRAHAWMIHLMRSLHFLTATYPLTILIINPTVDQKLRDDATKEDCLSAFASNASIKPALGRTWDWFLDVSCMISRPFERTDRRIHEGQNAEYLFEILHDRHGHRAERWATLDT